MRSKLAQIAGDVGGATGIKRFAGDFYHRHGRLGRNATNLAPNELVQHQVADDEQALFAGPLEDLLESFWIHKSESGCRRAPGLMRLKEVKEWS